MTILITGGGGFIGKHFVSSIASSVEKIYILDPIYQSYFEKFSSVEQICSSLQQINILANILPNVDMVYHFASNSVPGTSENNHILDLQNNLVGSIVLFDAMVSAGVKKIVFLSSGGAVYGNCSSFPTTEHAPLKPISSYGAIKASLENYLSVYAINYGLESIVLRPSNVYGEGVGRIGTFGFITTLLNNIKTNKDVTVYGDGNIIRDFIYINDFVDLLSKTLHNFKPGIYNVSSGESYSLNEIIEIVKEITHEDFTVNYKDSRNFDVNRVQLDNTKCKESFDWIPLIRLKQGISKLF